LLSEHYEQLMKGFRNDVMIILTSEKKNNNNHHNQTSFHYKL
jgi:hypothetical protein